MTKPPGRADDSDLARVRRLAWLLDDSIPLPGGYRIGIDGLLGLIPGAGDLAGVGASGYIVWQAYRFGAPAIVLTRMAGNILLEMVVGFVPLIGDVFDFAFKANRRNLALLETHLTEQRKTKRTSWAIVISATVVIVSAFAFSIFAMYKILLWVMGQL